MHQSRKYDRKNFVKSFVNDHPVGGTGFLNAVSWEPIV
jgi:hypothetical protein